MPIWPCQKFQPRKRERLINILTINNLFIMGMMKNKMPARSWSALGGKNGVYLVLITAVISGLANFFNKFGLEVLGKNAYQYTTLKNIIAAVILSLLILTPLIWPKLKKLSANDCLKLL